MITALHKLFFALYAVSAAAAALGFLLNKDWRRRSLYILIAAWAVNTAYIAGRWYVGGRAPMSNMYESLVFLIWTFAGAYLLFRRAYGPSLERLTPWAALLAALSTAATAFFPSDITPLMPALQSDWLLAHVSTVMAGYGALLLAFLCGAYYFFAGDKQQETEALCYRACLSGFWLLSLGIITGAVWANSAWGTYWSWDPKETWSLITWLYYAVAIHLRRTSGWRGPKFAKLMLWGFALVMFTYFGVNYLLPGLHSYA